MGQLRSEFRVAFVFVLVGLTGCPEQELGTVQPKVQFGSSQRLRQATSEKIDLLVLIDNSGSMKEEQRNLSDQFDEMISTLTSPPDRDGDGQPDYPPVSDLHVGIISTDMGTGGFAVRSCGDALDGDDAVLLNTGHGEDCQESYPAYLEFQEGDDPLELAADFGCIARLGTDGCGFEQQLKAVRKALTTHAAGANAGFFRPDSLLAVLLVTDEEDCSIRESPESSDIFDPNQTWLGSPNIRCANHGATYAEPVDNFVQDLLALRETEPERLVVAGIVGIPPDTFCAQDDYDCLLSQEARMQIVIEPDPEHAGSQRVRPSCDVAGLGEAYPPRRIVEFIQRIDQVSGNGTVHSICNADLSPAMNAITQLIQENITKTCVSRRLPVNDAGQVDCMAIEQLTSDAPCPAGRIDLGLDPARQRRCQVCQRGDGVNRQIDQLGTDLTECGQWSDSDYWEYVFDDASGECPGTGKINFAGRTVPEHGSVIYLECLMEVDERR